MPRKRKTPTGQDAQPISVAAGGNYGSRAATEAALAAVPINRGAVTPTPSAAPAAQAPSPMDAAAGVDGPRSLPLSAPSQYPDQPFSTGLDIGAGAGSESLPGGAPLAQQPTVDPERLRRWLPALEVLAEQPEASSETKNLVRYWRSTLR